MPSYDVEIFNVSADEPGQIDATVSLRVAKSGVGQASSTSASDIAQDIDLTVSGSEGVGASASVTSLTLSGSSFIASKNVFGANWISNLSPLFDPTSSKYIYGRVAHFLILQILNMTGGSRSTTSNNIRNLVDDNPLLWGVMHDSPLHATRAYEERNNRETSWRYKFLSRNRRDEVLAYIDFDNWTNQINGLRTPTTGFSSVSVMPNITNPLVYNYFGDYSADILMGTSFAQNPSIGADSGPDLSDRVGYYTDSTQIVSPNISARAQFSQNQGFVVSVVIDSSNQVDQVVINSAPGVRVEGEDIFFFNTNNIGFVGYVIGTYIDNGNGTATLLLNPLGSAADPLQDVVPAAGWRYNICNVSQTTQSLDWNSDGVSDPVEVGSTRWGAGWLSWGSRISDRVEQKNGHRSGWGGNMLNRSFSVWKDSVDGWPSPHVFTGQVDYCSYENWCDSVFAKPQSAANTYNMPNDFDPERLMRSIYFGVTYINDTPNDFMADKPRGAEFEVNVAGTSYSSLNVTDARYVEFLWSVIATVDKAHVGSIIHQLQNADPVAHEHYFLDLDTNFSGTNPIGTYDDAGGSVGGRGPRGSWSWASGGVGDFTDNGRRIYARRVGDVLLIININDLPAGYPSTYDPDWAVRDPEDILTASDFSSLYSGGMLSGGETLVWPDYDSYVNQRVTDYLQTNSLDWPGFNYGPRQDTPWGALNGINWMLADDARYSSAGLGGSTLNTSGTLDVNLYSSRVFLIQ